MDYERKELVLKEAQYLYKNKSTIRKTAKYFGVAKSTLHKDLHKYLPAINKRLYKKLLKLLSVNFKTKHIRGGQATKQKFATKKLKSEP